MFFQIKEIILWPKNITYPPQRVTFELGKVNIISGASRTGKSAIIPILDYCLGSDKCSIPVNTIRDACEWFGALISTPFGEKLLARREPGSQKSTGDMFVLEGAEIIIPREIPGKNNDVKRVKRMLDELVGLTTLDFDVEDTGNNFKGRPSFRDLAAFNFQPQNIVANPDVVFYKADTYEHREKLRNIFPYVLNAISPDIMAKRHELEALRKELQRKQKELDSIKQVSLRWIAELQSRVSEAKEIGLISSDVIISNNRNDLIELLRTVVNSTVFEVRITTETINEAVDELLQLQEEEKEISLELSKLRKRYSEMSQLKHNSKQYQGSLNIQRDRLKVSSWLSEINNPDHDCPVCGNTIDETEMLNELNKALLAIEKTAGEFNSVPASFDRELERVRGGIRLLTEKLEAIKIRRSSLDRSSTQVRNRQYEALKVSRFIGNLEQSLMTYDNLGADGDLSTDIQSLKDRVNSLVQAVSESNIENKKKRALEIVSSNASRLLPMLDVERPDDPIFLSDNNLSIYVKSLDREDYLWEIGSGSNWLSYHIAMTLGLQQFFLSIKESPIPSFIVYDQPSQVYFPKRLATPKNASDQIDDFEFKDEDVEAVKKVFESFSHVVKKSKGNLQIIVLDHANESVWGDIDDVYLVKEWRGGEKLVPEEWLNN
ncbi:DUF3732 domain-containing protein [Paenibacillus radicis (ex Xue et al. 2023)]|uniref:DUF3732 domain-containing protein n=1 Tax=Paenibacillus radicis (ex Xue et al. 2023) TaxID=2972489 RepID=A0ABT1YBY6_9BACL|nr:DUF3732 domain-containing protein [Paenibacillus radicis (ex Xue et al. 2023)]MCR8630712.1 DUF3732 domain-containing protein [Paenibacillus radicis (ex Xue et al. 2023)]